MNGSVFFVDDVYLAQNPVVEIDSTHAIFLPAIQRSTPPPEPYTLRCNPSGGSGGLAPGAHFTQVAGLEALVIVGSNYDPGRPTFLSFYLHGDLAVDYGANEQRSSATTGGRTRLDFCGSLGTFSLHRPATSTLSS